MNIILALWRFFKERGVFLIVVLFVISALRSSFNLSHQDDALNEARKRLAEEQAEQRRLEEVKKDINSSEFIEREARDKLGLVKEGEVVVVLPPEDVLRRFAPATTEDELLGEDSLPVWRRWIKTFLPDLEKSLPKA